MPKKSATSHVWKPSDWFWGFDPKLKKEIDKENDILNSMTLEQKKAVLSWGSSQMQQGEYFGRQDCGG